MMVVGLAISLCTVYWPNMQEAKPQDMFKGFRWLSGNWEGQGKNESGSLIVKAEFRLVLNQQFIESKIQYQTEPRDGKPAGPVHQDWGMLNFDLVSQKHVFRQFHSEGHVYHFLLEDASSDGKTFTFVAKVFDNVPAGWRARMIYKKEDDGELAVTFERAAPEKDFEKFAEYRLKRKKEEKSP